MDSRGARIMNALGSNVGGLRSHLISKNIQGNRQKKLPLEANQYEDGTIWLPYLHEYDTFFKIISEQDITNLRSKFPILDKMKIRERESDVRNSESLPLSETQSPVQNALQNSDQPYEEKPTKSSTNGFEKSEDGCSSEATRPSTPMRCRTNSVSSTSSSESSSTSGTSRSGSSSTSGTLTSGSSSLMPQNPQSLEMTMDNEGDDSEADPNYSFSGDDEISSDEFEDSANKTTAKAKTRKRKSNPAEWKSNIAKKRRNVGKKYKSKFSKKIVDRREMRPGCGERCQYKCSRKIEEEQRFNIFRKYWGLGDVNKQRDFISRCIKEVNRTQPNEGARGCNAAYFFTINGNRMRVCRQFFMATLDVSTTTLATVRKKIAGGVLEGDNRGKHRNHRKLSETVKNDIRNHINSIPRIPSHYLRAQSDREYIEGGRTIAQIYRDYVKNCSEEGKPCAKRTTFFEVFNEFNISFFIPKKDQCELCTVHENSGQKEKKQEFDEHLKEKELSRKEKERDKNESDPATIVCVYDLQAALPTPKGEVSVFYYKSKLSTYNLTIYNLKTREAVCNTWHEGEGNRGVIEIATSVFRYIEGKAKESTQEVDFIFYSDNCSGQQKNKFMLTMYSYALCMFRNIKSITHKFLIKGHTQNEGDTVHSVIEKEIKRTLKSGNIYVPSQYFQIMRTAKKQAPFYEVNELSHGDFMDFKALASELGQNFTVNLKNETFPFTNIKMWKITRENPFVFHYKTSYQEDELNTVDTFDAKGKKKNTRGSGNIVTVEERINKTKEWVIKKAYRDSISISDNKKRDLMYLAENNYIKRVYFDFYNSLK